MHVPVCEGEYEEGVCKWKRERKRNKVGVERRRWSVWDYRVTLKEASLSLFTPSFYPMIHSLCTLHFPTIIHLNTLTPPISIFPHQWGSPSHPVALHEYLSALGSVKHFPKVGVNEIIVLRHSGVQEDGLGRGEEKECGMKMKGELTGNGREWDDREEGRELENRRGRKEGRRRKTAMADRKDDESSKEKNKELKRMVARKGEKTRGGKGEEMRRKWWTIGKSSFERRLGELSRQEIKRATMTGWKITEILWGRENGGCKIKIRDV